MSRDQARLLMAGFTNWAQQQRSCRALAVAGSWAGDTAQPTSDLDLLILTSDLPKWTTQAMWLSELARHLGLPYLEAELEAYGVARSWRAWFGRNVELELTFAELSWANVSPLDPGTRRVVSDGIRPLVDKDGLLRTVFQTLWNAG
jgi:predicted nucleotidyltransferase